MNFIRILFVFFAALTQLTNIQPSWAQPEPFDGGPEQALVDPQQHGNQRDRAKFRDQLHKELNLSEDQRQALKALKETRQQNRELQMKVMQQRKELNEALRSGLYSESQVMDRVREINESSAQLNTGRVRNIIDLKKALKPEQLSKLRDFMKQHRQQRQERMQQFRESRDGQGFKRGGQGGPGFGQERRSHGQGTQR